MLWESRCFDCENGIVRHCELLRPLSCILPVLPSLLMRKATGVNADEGMGFARRVMQELAQTTPDLSTFYYIGYCMDETIARKIFDRFEIPD